MIFEFLFQAGLLLHIVQWGLVLLMIGSIWGEVAGARYCKDGKVATKVRPCPEDHGWREVNTEPRSLLGWIILGWILGFFLLTATVTLLCILWVLLRYLVSPCALSLVLISLWQAP